MRTWIFQSNPDDFDIDEYIKLEDPLWTIKQEHFAQQMEIGGIVYIWKSKGKVGSDAEIIAKVELVSKAGNYSDNRAKELYTSEKKYQESLSFKTIKSRIISRGSIWKKDLRKDDILKNLDIINMARKTNYLIEDSEQEKRLNLLWSKNSN